MYMAYIDMCVCFGNYKTVIGVVKLALTRAWACHFGSGIDTLWPA